MRQLVGLTLMAMALAVPTLSHAASDGADREEQFLNALPDDIRWLMTRKKRVAPPPAPAPVGQQALTLPPPPPITASAPCAPGTIAGPPVAAAPAASVPSLPSVAVPGPVQLTPAPRLQVLYSRDGSPRFQVLAPRPPRPGAPVVQAPPPPPPAPVTAPQVSCIPDPMANVAPDPVSTGSGATIAGLDPLDGTTDAVDYLPGSNLDNGWLPPGGAAPAQEVPEPGSLALLGAGLAALGLVRRRRRA